MSQAKHLYDRALEQFKEERLAEAVSLLEEALKQDSRFLDAYEALGLIYFRQNRLDDAIRVMQDLARIEPDNIMAHTNLSRFLAKKGLIEEAEKEQAEARRLSWKAELKTKKAEGAGVSDEDPEAVQRLLEEKIATYRQVIELDPNDVLGYFSLGTVYWDGKMYGPAREAFEKAVAVNPNHSPSYMGLGQSLEALGCKGEASEIYRKGIQVADRQGDIIPLKKMETRLARLESSPG